MNGLMLEKLKNHENRIQVLEGIGNVDSWSGVQRIVRAGLGSTIIAAGDQLSTYGASAVSVAVSGSGITDASVDFTTFITAIGQSDPLIYVFEYDGMVWNFNDNAVDLAAYGVTVIGTPQDGDHVVVTVDSTEQCFDVVDHSIHTPVNPALTNTMALLLHDIAAYGTIPFCPPQLLYYTDVELPAGKYRFTLEHGTYGGGTEQDGTYIFDTDGTAIPADGGIRHSAAGAYNEGGYAKTDITGGKVIIYGPGDARAIVKDNIACSEWDEVTECYDLGTFTARSTTYHTADGKHNFTERNTYGSNRWKTSVARQWLNSDGAPVPDGSEVVSNWYTRQTVFDRPPGGAKLAGYLYGLDTALVAVICPVKVKTAIPDPDRIPDGEIYEETEDKVWLASLTEIYGSLNSNVAEGSQFAYWKDTTDAAKIKYQGSTARIWWLRGAYPGDAHFVRLVNTSGALDYHLARNASGFVPGLCIG